MLLVIGTGPMLNSINTMNTAAHLILVRLEEFMPQRLFQLIPNANMLLVVWLAKAMHSDCLFVY
jgi:hypothetical protein